MEYKCNKCGCTEFISDLNQYDVFISQKDEIILTDTVFVDDKLVLYCRECGEKLEFNNDDVK